MTYQDAVNYLKNAQVDMKSIESVCEASDLIETCKKALEKQIPKKPIHKHKNYYCPICKEDGWVLWDDAEPNDFDNFCGKCGQAIDWGDECE